MDLNTPLNQLSAQNEFAPRHIGPSETDKKSMLRELGFSDTDELISKVVPKSIMTKATMSIGQGVSEFDILNRLKSMMKENKIFER